jgi:hypothetical protein
MYKNVNNNLNKIKKAPFYKIIIGTIEAEFEASNDRSKGFKTGKSGSLNDSTYDGLYKKSKTIGSKYSTNVIFF